MDDPIQAGVDLINQIHTFNRAPSDVGKTISATATENKAKRKKRKTGRPAKTIATPAEDPILDGLDLVNQIQNFNCENGNVAKTASSIPIDDPVRDGLDLINQINNFDQEAIVQMKKAQNDPANDAIFQSLGPMPMTHAVAAGLDLIDQITEFNQDASAQMKKARNDPANDAIFQTPVGDAMALLEKARDDFENHRPNLRKRNHGGPANTGQRKKRKCGRPATTTPAEEAYGPALHQSVLDLSKQILAFKQETESVASAIHDSAVIKKAEPGKRKSPKCKPAEDPIQPGVSTTTQTDAPSVDQLVKAQRDPTMPLAVRRGPPRKRKRLSGLPDLPGVPTRPTRDRCRPDRLGD